MMTRFDNMADSDIKNISHSKSAKLLKIIEAFKDVVGNTNDFQLSRNTGLTIDRCKEIIELKNSLKKQS